MARRRRPSPAQLIRRISRPAPPSELPCGSRCSAALRLPTLGYTVDSPLGSVRYRAGVRCGCRVSGVRWPLCFGWFGNVQILTNLFGEKIIDFGMSRD
jgi:hypothetical protein